MLVFGWLITKAHIQHQHIKKFGLNGGWFKKFKFQLPPKKHIILAALIKQSNKHVDVERLNTRLDKFNFNYTKKHKDCNFYQST